MEDDVDTRVGHLWVATRKQQCGLEGKVGVEVHTTALRTLMLVLPLVWMTCLMSCCLAGLAYTLTVVLYEAALSKQRVSNVRVMEVASCSCTFSSV